MTEQPTSNKGLAEFLRTKADGAGADDAALFGLCARVIEASAEPATPASNDQLAHALERVAVYRKDPSTALPYARSMIALADEIERLRQIEGNLRCLRCGYCNFGAAHEPATPASKELFELQAKVADLEAGWSRCSQACARMQGERDEARMQYSRLQLETVELRSRLDRAADEPPAAPSGERAYVLAALRQRHAETVAAIGHVMGEDKSTIYQRAADLIERTAVPPASLRNETVRAAISMVDGFLQDAGLTADSPPRHNLAVLRSLLVTDGAAEPPHVTQEVQNVLAWLRTVELVCYARDDRQSVIYIGQARALLHRLSRASEPPPAARDEHDESGRTGVFRNCGYVGTACGWIVRDGTYWVATFRGDVDASQYVAFRNAPPPPKSRKCAADMYADPPRDCDAPFCGCNPAWDQCIQMLQECNLLVDRKARVMSCGEAGAVGKSETPTGGVCTQTPGPGSIPGTAQPPHQGMEEVDASELTVDAIRKRAAAFNHWFRTNGGFKGYEAQAIDVLLGRIDALEVPAEPPSVEAGKCNSSHIPMGGQNFIPPAVEKPARQVGCEGDDGLLRVHSEEERCDVCLHTRDVHTRRYRCMGCDKDVAECTCGRAGETSECRCYATLRVPFCPVHGETGASRANDWDDPDTYGPSA